jgi:hypothetical protein
MSLGFQSIDGEGLLYRSLLIDCKGKPSVAQMVRFDDQAREP